MADTKARTDKGARFLLIAASLVLVVAGMRAVRPIALPLLLAVFLSILSAPLLGWQLQHRVPKVIAVLLTVLANITVMALLLLLVGGSISSFAESIPRYQERVEAKVEAVLDDLQSFGIDTSELAWLEQTPEEITGETVDPTAESPPAEPGGLINLSSVVDLIGATLRGIASILSMTLLVFLLMVFMLFEASTFPRRLRLAFGWSSADLLRITVEIQRYLQIKTFISLLTGLFIGIALWLFGVEYALLWGLIAFLLNYIPSVGSIIASVPPVTLSLIDVGVGRATLVACVFLAINLTFGNFLEPHLMGRRFGISTLVVVLSLIFWGWLWGPVGMLLSVPLTMILKIALENTEDSRWVAQLISARNLRAKPEKALASTEG